MLCSLFLCLLVGGFVVDFLRHRILREDFVDNFDGGVIVIFEIEKEFLGRIRRKA